MLIDSHCHLNYLDEPEQAILRARESGVTSCLCISVDEPGFAGVMALASSHDDIWASAGVHPDAAGGNLDWIEDALAASEVVAVGETGLDYMQGTEPDVRARQREAFDLQLGLGVKHQLPPLFIPGPPRMTPWICCAPTPARLAFCIASQNLGQWLSRPWIWGSTYPFQES